MKLKESVFQLFGVILSKMRSLYVHAKIKNAISKFATFGQGSSLAYPFSISGVNHYDKFDNPDDSKNIWVFTGMT